MYIEDAIGERVWVDHPDCKGFVENICTAFDTKMPSSNLFFSQASKPPSDSASGPGRESPGPGSGQGGGGGGGGKLLISYYRVKISNNFIWLQL